MPAGRRALLPLSTRARLRRAEELRGRNRSDRPCATIDRVSVRTTIAALGALAGGLALVACESSSPFERDAVPVLEARCVSGRCHGVAPGETAPVEGYFVGIDGDERIADQIAARRASLARVTTLGPATSSSLLRVPMSRSSGGGPHAGGALFTGTEDPAAVALSRWIENEPAGTGGEDTPLDERQRLFGDTVLPTLIERCGRAGCHGPTDVANTAFPARRDPVSGRIAPAEIARAYNVLRKHLDLWSDDPSRSRLVGKAIGVSEGGLVHRGGDNTFFPEAELGRPMSAPGIEAILAWARAEREHLGVTEGKAPTSLLFIRAEIHRSPPYRVPSHDEPERPAGDLHLVSWPVSPESHAENLTASLHPDRRAEVRDPSVSHDARRVVFSMRAADERWFSVWEMELDSRSARRVSSSDIRGSLVQCTHAPSSHLVCAWDGSGISGADGPGNAPDLVSLDTELGTIEPLTFTPVAEVHPAFIAAGKSRGGVLFGTRRGGVTGGLQGMLFRFPLDHDSRHHPEPEYHVHFGESIAPLAPLLGRDLPDGRQVLVVLPDAEVDDDRGQLALLDRSLGPSVVESRLDHVSSGGYRAPIAWLDRDVRWRDPAPLPDGRILVARDDPTRPGDDAIVAVSLESGVGGYLVREVAPILDAPGLADRSPVVVYPRPPEDDPHETVLDPSSDVGYLVLRDLAVLESVFGRTAPEGSRPRRSDIVGLRLSVWEDGPRHLADVALESDGSAYLAISARTPVRLQTIDAEGRVVGRQLDRWYFAEGNERVPAGTNEATYPHACSSCHGSFSGDPDDSAAQEPDAISAASVTLATHEGRDRRRPRPPIDLRRGLR